MQDYQTLISEQLTAALLDILVKSIGNNTDPALFKEREMNSIARSHTDIYDPIVMQNLRQECIKFVEDLVYLNIRAMQIHPSAGQGEKMTPAEARKAARMRLCAKPCAITREGAIVILSDFLAMAILPIEIQHVKQNLCKKDEECFVRVSRKFRNFMIWTGVESAARMMCNNGDCSYIDAVERFELSVA